MVFILFGYYLCRNVCKSIYIFGIFFPAKYTVEMSLILIVTEFNNFSFESCCTVTLFSGNDCLAVNCGKYHNSSDNEHF